MMYKQFAGSPLQIPPPTIVTHMFTGFTGMGKRRIAIFTEWSAMERWSGGFTIDKYLNKECQVSNYLLFEYYVHGLSPGYYGLHKCCKKLWIKFQIVSMRVTVLLLHQWLMAADECHRKTHKL